MRNTHLEKLDRIVSDICSLEAELEWLHEHSNQLRDELQTSVDQLRHILTEYPELPTQLSRKAYQRYVACMENGNQRIKETLAAPDR